VAGLVAGGLIVGLAGLGASGDTVTVRTVTPTASAAPGPSGTNPADTTVSVTPACVTAITQAQAATAAIGDLISAVRSFNPSSIDAAIRRLQPLQSQLQAALPDCRVITRLPNGSVTTSPLPPAPTTS
jgi:hypothetical protein